MAKEGKKEKRGEKKEGGRQRLRFGVMRARSSAWLRGLLCCFLAVLGAGPTYFCNSCDAGGYATDPMIPLG